MAGPVVIGSGHAGWAAVTALVARGLRPTVLDVGVDLPPDRRRLVDRLAAVDPGSWAAADVAALEENDTLADPLPRRLAFGSAHGYADGHPLAALDRASPHGPVPSVARGGFSTVWSGAMLPTDDRDATDWPVRRADLAPHYRAVLAAIPFAAADDALTGPFPLYHDTPLAPGPDPAMAALADRLARRAAGDGTVVGRARLAHRPPGTPGGCRSCGHCHAGCAYDAIWSTAPDLARLAAAGAIDYRPGVVVRALREDGDEVAILCDRVDGTPHTVRASRVYVAAGAIASTRIVLASLGAFDRPVRLLATQGFAAPVVLPRIRPGPRADVTLPTLFVELEVPGHDHWFHIQVGAPNDLAVAKLLHPHPERPVRRRLVDQAARRTLVALGNAHSDHAGHHLLTLRRAAEGPHRLRIEPVPAPAFPALARRVARRLARALAPAGALVLPPVGALAGPEPVGWHVGGSLPMRSTPRGELDTDRLGRPTGWSRVHVVDASVLPSIPATTIALPAMANAHRIASEAPDDR